MFKTAQGQATSVPDIAKRIFGIIMSDKTAGSLFNAAGLWYVLGGGRSHESGAFAYVSSYGGYWASDVPGSNELAYKLHFNSSTLLDRAQYDGRACAFGVRCVKD